MTLLQVDVGDLARTAGQLRAAVAVARDVHASARSVAAEVADCGSRHLADAAHDLLDAWAHGMGLVAADADGLADALGAAAAAYAQVEQAIMAAAGGR